MIFYTAVALLVPAFSSTSEVFAASGTPETNLYHSQSIRDMEWQADHNLQGEPIPIVKGTSQVLRFDRSIARASISNEDICDLTTIDKREILINAKQAGLINLIVWDQEQNVSSYEIRSTLEVSKLSDVLNKVDPKAHFTIVPFGATVAVYGSVENARKLAQIEDAVNAFDEKAISFLKIADPKQILLEVRFAEVNRKANEDYGLDAEVIAKRFFVRSLTGGSGALAPDGGSQPNTSVFGGSDTTSTFTPKGSAVEFAQLIAPAAPEQSNLYGAFVNDEIAIQPFLNWLEQKNILKIIARPNLVTKDGEEASFVVGGEFPIPVATLDRIDIEFKEFGTKLVFTPEIRDEGMIRLKVDSSVSELDFSNTVSIAGTVIPTLLKREHQTIVELRSNETLVIGGLLTQRVNHIFKKLPVLGDIPLLKRLFRKEEFSRTDVELIVIITPHLVEPMRTKEKKNLYDSEKVLNSVRPFHPPYRDEQGDMIRNLIVQEEHRYFDEKEAKAAAKRLEDEVVREKMQQLREQEKLEEQMNALEKKRESDVTQSAEV